jgi:hypothetical protein
LSRLELDGLDFTGSDCLDWLRSFACLTELVLWGRDDSEDPDAKRLKVFEACPKLQSLWHSNSGSVVTVHRRHDKLIRRCKDSTLEL